MATSHFERPVVIVGARPAGSALAAHLGAQGIPVVLLDRATFPSLPAVPSSPLLYPAAMQLLDELGVAPSSYVDPHGMMPRLLFQFYPWWNTSFPVPTMFGRDYVLGIDRARFDRALSQQAEQHPSVSLRQGFLVSDLVRDDAGRVVGVIGGPPGGTTERIDASCVVGADGRFSMVARRVHAEIFEEESKCVSTTHYADWEGVAPPLDGGHGGHVVATGRGLDVLFFAMPDGRFSVNIHARADRVVVDGDPERYYLDTLRSLPPVAERLAPARRVSRIVGIKRIGNGYRQATGPGWVLVGDAFHFKDPADGQGIYDALLEAKLLAQALVSWRSGLTSWEDAMSGYARAAYEATHPMYLATTSRLRRELYSEPPELVIRTMIRWMMSDPAYQDHFVRYLGRCVPPDPSPPALVAGAMARGLGRDLAAAMGFGRR